MSSRHPALPRLFGHIGYMSAWSGLDFVVSTFNARGPSVGLSPARVMSLKEARTGSRRHTSVRTCTDPWADGNARRQE